MLPGFSATSSLYRTNQLYRGYDTSASTTQSAEIKPAICFTIDGRTFCAGGFGGFERCPVGCFGVQPNCVCPQGCPPGLTDCSHLWGFPICKNLQSDPNNCGACGASCPEVANATSFCGPEGPYGQPNCGIVCNSGYTNCAGPYGDVTCVNTGNDPNNCGSCGRVCMAPANGTVTCSDGQCIPHCNRGYVNCSGSCTDTLTDPNNCGACGTICTGGQKCEQGSCECPSSRPDLCNGVCTNLQFDNNNCGCCSTFDGNCSCDIYGPCVNGRCQGAGGGSRPSCAAGESDCLGECIGVNDQCCGKSNSGVPSWCPSGYICSDQTDQWGFTICVPS